MFILNFFLFIINIVSANNCIEIGNFNNNRIIACPIQKLNNETVSRLNFTNKTLETFNVTKKLNSSKMNSTIIKQREYSKNNTKNISGFYNIFSPSPSKDNIDIIEPSSYLEIIDEENNEIYDYNTPSVYNTPSSSLDITKEENNENNENIIQTEDEYVILKIIIILLCLSGTLITLLYCVKKKKKKNKICNFKEKVYIKKPIKTENSDKSQTTIINIGEKEEKEVIESTSRIEPKKSEDYEDDFEEEEES